MAAVFFFIAGIGAICGAVGVVMLRNPFYAVLALVFHLLSLAALFLLLRAQFVAAAQVVVYAGAVMVLYVFVVAYVGGRTEPLRPPVGRGQQRDRGALRGSRCSSSWRSRCSARPEGASTPTARTVDAGLRHARADRRSCC